MKKLPVCEVIGCDETALVEDLRGNKMCLYCMENEIAETGTTGDDYKDPNGEWATSQEIPLAVQ